MEWLLSLIAIYLAPFQPNLRIDVTMFLIGLTAPRHDAPVAPLGLWRMCYTPFAPLGLYTSGLTQIAYAARNSLFLTP